jgi:hypothetical protein
MQKKNFRIYSIIALFTILTIVAVVGIILYFQRESVEKIAIPPPPAHVAYKINLDSMNIVYGTVANNQNLSTLLSGYVSNELIDRIAKNTSEVFDVRKFKAGNRYARIVSKDTLKTTRYFIYEINPIDYVVYDFRDSLKAYKDKKKVTRAIKTATGTITSSLWNCFVENKLDVNLALALSDVYAWTVDFYGLQKGDNFKVIYEEVYVEEKMVGIDRILASKFQSSGKDFFA